MTALCMQEPISYIMIYKLLYIFSVVRIETSDQSYRGFAIQAREFTPSFSSAAAFVGEFVNPPQDTRIWSCAAVCHCAWLPVSLCFAH